MCSAIRPEAVALVDAWDFPDRALNSTIGGFDGDVYEKQYKVGDKVAARWVAGCG
jgi:acyl-CoA oxidase